MMEEAKFKPTKYDDTLTASLLMDPSSVLDAFDKEMVTNPPAPIRHIQNVNKFKKYLLPEGEKTEVLALVRQIRALRHLYEVFIKTTSERANPYLCHAILRVIEWNVDWEIGPRPEAIYGARSVLDILMPHLTDTFSYWALVNYETVDTLSYRENSHEKDRGSHQYVREKLRTANVNLRRILIARRVSELQGMIDEIISSRS